MSVDGSGLAFSCKFVSEILSTFDSNICSCFDVVSRDLKNFFGRGAAYNVDVFLTAWGASGTVHSLFLATPIPESEMEFGGGGIDCSFDEFIPLTVLREVKEVAPHFP
jgi:hypothetical protein